jgi:hypothetical protein
MHEPLLLRDAYQDMSLDTMSMVINDPEVDPALVILAMRTYDPDAFAAA